MKWIGLSETQKKRLKKEYLVAALSGSGIPLADVAEETSIDVSGVKVILEEKVVRNENGLGDVYREFREEVRPAVRALLLKALVKMDRKLDRRNFEYKDGILLIRELALLAGVSPNSYEGQVQQTTTTRRVDLTNAENVRAVAKAMMQEREAKLLTETEQTG